MKALRRVEHAVDERLRDAVIADEVEAERLARRAQGRGGALKRAGLAAEIGAEIDDRDPHPGVAFERRLQRIHARASRKGWKKRRRRPSRCQSMGRTRAVTARCGRARGAVVCMAMMSERRSFDYVIVGAGSAGCLLADRLSAAPGVRVCLIEAGGRDSDPLIHIPIGVGKLHQRRMHDWGYDTEIEPGLGNRAIESMRGKVLGGSSSINVMTHVRGNRGDYDRWAASGCAGWSYDEVLPYFRRYESWEGGEDQWRGGMGPLTVGRLKATDPFLDAVLAAATDGGFPITPDYNGASQDGFARGQTTIRAGRRCSAAVAFLRPALARGHVTLISRVLATNLVMAGHRAVGVAYLSGTERHEVFAEREVILSAGVFNTPQLLMLSGIGPADHLRATGITPLVDLPGVGGNLQDHLAVKYCLRAARAGAVSRADARRPRRRRAGAGLSLRHRPGDGAARRRDRFSQDAQRLRRAGYSVLRPRHRAQCRSVVSRHQAGLRGRVLVHAGAAPP